MKLTVVRFKWLLLVGLLSLTVSTVNAQETTAIQNALVDCLFGMPTDEIIGETALCGELTVPENWQKPDERPIALHYVVLKARSAAPFLDPVIYLEGGPGASALVNVPFLAESFAEIRRYRDVIIYDQRGTSFSTPLFCPSDLQNAPLANDLRLPELPTSADPEIQVLLDTTKNLSAFSTAINCRPYLESQGFDLKSVQHGEQRPRSGVPDDRTRLRSLQHLRHFVWHKPRVGIIPVLPRTQSDGFARPTQRNP